LNIVGSDRAFEFVSCGMEKEKRRQGNPGKFRPFAEALVTLLEKPDKVIATNDDEDIGINFRVIAMTDKGLVSAVNDMVEPHERISLRTYERYKSGGIPDKERDWEYVLLFVSAYEKALECQRYMLARALSEDVPGGWQRYAWMLERKFDEFNMTRKEKVEVSDIGRLVLRGRDDGDGDVGDVL
jgi:hypothetical protein